MLQDMISPHDHLSIDDITSPLSAQIFDFDNPELFQETFNQTSVAFGSFQDNHSGTTTTTENSSSNNNNIKHEGDKDDENNADLSIIFDSHEDFENDIAASIDFSPSSLQYPIIDHLLDTTNQDQYGFSSGVQDVHDQLPNILYSGDPLANSSVFEENCLSSLPSYNIGLNPTSPSAPFFCNSGLPAYMANISAGLLSSGTSPGNIQLGSESNKPYDQFVKFQGENSSLFPTESIKPIFNPEDLQGLSGIENQALGPVEIAGLEDSTLNKVEKLSPEQRKEKIHRYMKKRNERNFSKKIKYACRKTLADSRPRVRGRFAKNDECFEPNKQASSSHHHDIEYEDMGVKEEEQLVDFSEAFAQISGANSFKFNYTIQSWI